MAPDYVQAEGTEQARELCIPFGEQFGVYSEVYFSCREALNKRFPEWPPQAETPAFPDTGFRPRGLK